MQAAWCYIAQVCPQEGEGTDCPYSVTRSWRSYSRILFAWTPAVEDVESCTASRGAKNKAPGSIPRKCRAQMERLDACIAAHQEQQEEPG